MVHEVTDETFEKEVLNCGMPCLLDFHAEWCESCKHMAPRLEQLSDEYEGKVKFCGIDTGPNRKLRIKFAVGTLPYIVLLHDGKQTPLFDSAVSEDKIRERIDGVLAAGEAPTTMPFKW